MAFGYLKTAGLTTNSEIDFSKTSVKLLAQEKIGKDLYNQVHLITFTKKPEDLVTLARRSNDQIQVITVNEASSQECSMSAVDVYVISRHLGGR
jgi:hypothetical protein